MHDQGLVATPSEVAIVQWKNEYESMRLSRRSHLDGSGSKTNTDAKSESTAKNKYTRMQTTSNAHGMTFNLVMDATEEESDQFARPLEPSAAHVVWSYSRFYFMPTKTMGVRVTVRRKLLESADTTARPRNGDWIEFET